MSSLSFVLAVLAACSGASSPAAGTTTESPRNPATEDTAQFAAAGSTSAAPPSVPANPPAQVSRPWPGPMDEPPRRGVPWNRSVRPLLGPVSGLGEFCGAAALCAAYALKPGESGIPTQPLGGQGAILEVSIWNDAPPNQTWLYGQHVLAMRTSRGWFVTELVRIESGMENTIRSLRWEPAAPGVLRVEHRDGLTEGAMDGHPSRDHYSEVVMFCGVVDDTPACTGRLTLRDDDRKALSATAKVARAKEGVRVTVAGATPDKGVYTFPFAAAP